MRGFFLRGVCHRAYIARLSFDGVCVAGATIAPDRAVTVAATVIARFNTRVSFLCRGSLSGAKL